MQDGVRHSWQVANQPAVLRRRPIEKRTGFGVFWNSPASRNSEVFVMKVTGNTILITGGTSGIGRALAEELHAKGNKVIIAGRRQNLLDQITGQHAGMVGMAVDVGDSGSIERFANDVKKQFPNLNVLINNAGIARIEDYTAAAIDTSDAMQVIQTNIMSVIQLSAALLPTLRAQPNS